MSGLQDGIATIRVAGKSRSQLPQIPTNMIPEFIRYLQTLSTDDHTPGYNVGMVSDVSATGIKIPVKFLKPSQKHINAEKVKQLLVHVDDFKNDVFIVSKDNEILDGHHRWAALKLWNDSHTVKAIRVNMTIDELISAARDFDGSITKSVFEIIRLRDMLGF